MVKQFANVATRYGAPMGRTTSPLDTAPRSVRLFKVRLDSGGYDNGGAYWGLGNTLWCAEDESGGRQFVRASSRERAAFELDISPAALVRRLSGLDEYCYAMFDGRAPYPAGKDKAAVFRWLKKGTAQ